MKNITAIKKSNVKTIAFFVDNEENKIKVKPFDGTVFFDLLLKNTVLFKYYMSICTNKNS